MSQSKYTSFAVAGAGPALGTFIVEALLAQPTTTSVVVFTRPKSTRTFPGAKVVPVDYSDEAAIAAHLKENNVEVVISVVGQDIRKVQGVLADAAKKSGTVKLFVPSDFGNPTDGYTEGPWGEKDGSAKYLKSIGLPFLRIYNGYFASYVPIITGFTENGKVSILRNPGAVGSVTDQGDIAGFLAHILTTLPPSSLHNKTYRIQGQAVSMSDIAKILGTTVVVVDTIPGPAPAQPFFTFLQGRFADGAGSTGWNESVKKEGTEGEEKAGSANGLWEGHHWKTIKEVLAL